MLCTRCVAYTVGHGALHAFFHGEFQAVGWVRFMTTVALENKWSLLNVSQSRPPPPSPLRGVNEGGGASNGRPAHFTRRHAHPRFTVIVHYFKFYYYNTVSIYICFITRYRLPQIFVTSHKYFLMFDVK